MDDPTVRGRCNHNNKCMVTVFGRTHCVLDPEQRYGAGDRGVTATPRVRIRRHRGLSRASTACTSLHAWPSARAPSSRVGIVMNP